MKYVFSFGIIISVVFALLSNRSGEVTNAVMSEGQNAVELAIVLAGSMAFWGGIMKIAEKSGLTDVVAKLFRPVIRLIFPGVNPEGSAFRAIVMNLTANLLGLGNAATPLGIRAVKELSKEENANGYATKNIVTFVVMNTASIQLLPVTAAALRLSYGAEAPFDILPAVLITSLASVTVGIAVAKALCSENLRIYSRRKLADESN